MASVTIVCTDPKKRAILEDRLAGRDDITFAAKEQTFVDLVVLAPSTPGEALEQLHQTTSAAGVLLVLPKGAAAGKEASAWNRVLNLADDFVSGVDSPLLLASIQKNLERRVSFEELDAARLDTEVILELTQALVSSLDFQEILFTVVRRIAEVFGVSRASVVVTPSADEAVGYVVAASDNSEIKNVEIDLWKYPEIRAVRRSRQSLTISDVATHSLFEEFRDQIPDNIRGVTLFPIVWQDDAVGVLFLRHTFGSAQLGARKHQLCQAVANATAIALRNARVMQTLRQRSAKQTEAQEEAKRQIAELEHYADLFTAAGDGMVVVAADGSTRFANPRALEIIEARQDQVEGLRLFDLVHEEDRDAVREIWEKIRRGIFERSVDVRIVSLRGNVRVLSFSFSPMGEDVLMTSQDVTDQRRTEAELVKTMEFLESLIDASVDGIVAADMNGNIILFNKSAERIYGHKAGDAIGHLTTRQLYPKGVAMDIMRRLKSEDFGGFGRLEPTRITAIHKNGDPIPIRLSSAMIFEDGKPSATFGIFTDMRERLQVEQRLAEVQERLESSEKHMLVAEVAGAAAHELNQPLTSLMGYAELLKRKLEDTTAEHRAATVMLREAERMAEIVRKLGRVTTYQTKAYVGSQRILDIDSK